MRRILFVDTCKRWENRFLAKSRSLVRVSHSLWRTVTYVSGWPPILLEFFEMYNFKKFTKKKHGKVLGNFKKFMNKRVSLIIETGKHLLKWNKRGKYGNLEWPIRRVSCWNFLIFIIFYEESIKPRTGLQLVRVELSKLRFSSRKHTGSSLHGGHLLHC